MRQNLGGGVTEISAFCEIRQETLKGRYGLIARCWPPSLFSSQHLSMAMISHTTGSLGNVDMFEGHRMSTPVAPVPLAAQPSRRSSCEALHQPIQWGSFWAYSWPGTRGWAEHRWLRRPIWAWEFSNKAQATFIAIDGSQAHRSPRASPHPKANSWSRPLRIFSSSGTIPMVR